MIQKMSKIFKLITLLLICGLVAGGCSMSHMSGSVSGKDSLKGKNIGVRLGFDADYSLSKRSDLNVVRYNSYSEALLAMKCGYIDYIALNQIEANHLGSFIKGVKVTGEPIDRAGFVFCFNKRQKLVDEFNDFLVEFKTTDEYKDIMKRFTEFSGDDFESKEVSLTGTGKTITYATSDFAYPWAYYDVNDDKHKGVEIEIMSHFANAKGYKLNIVGENDSLLLLRLSNDTADVVSGSFSDIYKEEAKMIDVYKMSDSYGDNDIYLLERDKSEKMSLEGEVD